MDAGNETIMLDLTLDTNSLMMKNFTT